MGTTRWPLRFFLKRKVQQRTVFYSSTFHLKITVLGKRRCKVKLLPYGSLPVLEYGFDIMPLNMWMVWVVSWRLSDKGFCPAGLFAYLLFHMGERR